MASQIALFLCTLFIIFLFYREWNLRPMSSKALWVVLIWITIIGTRTVSSWLGVEVSSDQIPGMYLEGTPLDRNIYLALIIAGIWILINRQVDWGRVVDSNRWFFAFIIYCGISIIWSDYPIVGFKRWIKELGNILMVLIILTEINPAQAVRAVFARYTFLAVPLSVLFIKYFPSLGRYYNQWSGEAMLTGVATEKNALGLLTFICGIFLVWDVIEIFSKHKRKTNKLDIMCRCLLLLMVFWLIGKTDSLTARICFLPGAIILLLVRLPAFKRQVRYFGTYCLILGILLSFLYAIPGVFESLVSIAGRDMTFTGRTEIWAEVLKEPINPLFGTGYQSFWLGSGGVNMWDKYYFHPVQAHNGYLEIYLNCGLIGLCLLIATLVSTGSKLKKKILDGSTFEILLFSLYVTALLYNWTEAMFSGLNLIWIILIVAALYNHPQSKTMTRTATLKLSGIPAVDVPT